MHVLYTMLANSVCTPSVRKNCRHLYSSSVVGTDLESSILPHTAIRECMKGIYENEENHLSAPKVIISKPEIIKISAQPDSDK